MALSRRKFLVTAVASGAICGAGGIIARGDRSPVFVWRGAALGGEARVSLYDSDEDRARSALHAVAQEIERLEAIFSLHRETSEISHLNAFGGLDAPSHDLVECLRTAVRWQRLTEGAFNPLVQPLWQAAARGNEITQDLLHRAQGTIALRPERITLPTGSRITLNGIAQGRIADRVTEILLQHGFLDVVAEAGELRLPGKERRAVGIPAIKSNVSVCEVAIATSEPKALIFDPTTFRHHLIDPRSGASPRHWESISVFAPTAEMADALSTAFAVLPYEAVGDMAASFGDVSVIGADPKGRVRVLGDTRLQQ